MAISQTTVWETVAASPSSTACFNVPHTATIKGDHRFEWPGSRPCSAEQYCAGYKQPGIALLQKGSEIVHIGILAKVRLSYSPVVKYYPSR